MAQPKSSAGVRRINHFISSTIADARQDVTVIARYYAIVPLRRNGSANTGSGIDRFNILGSWVEWGAGQM